MMKSKNPIDRRELRVKIGRARRRIDVRLRATATEGRKLMSWQTYVARYPGSSLLAAFGLGVTGATADSRSFIGRLAALLWKGAADRAVKLAFRALERWWKSAGEKS
jgi:hypothetical protein